MLVCEVCGSKDIQTKAWVDVNTLKYVDSCSDGEEEDNWCCNCNVHAGFLTEEEFEESKKEEE